MTSSEHALYQLLSWWATVRVATEQSRRRRAACGRTVERAASDEGRPLRPTATRKN